MVLFIYNMAFDNRYLYKYGSKCEDSSSLNKESKANPEIPLSFHIMSGGPRRTKRRLTPAGAESAGWRQLAQGHWLGGPPCAFCWGCPGAAPKPGRGGNPRRARLAARNWPRTTSSTDKPWRVARWVPVSPAISSRGSLLNSSRISRLETVWWVERWNLPAMPSRPSVPAHIFAATYRSGNSLLSSTFKTSGFWLLR